jgi:hypothetical protein
MKEMDKITETVAGMVIIDCLNDEGGQLILCPKD